MLKLFYSDRFVPRLPAGHRFPIAKYGLVREQLIYEGSMGVEQFEEAIPIPEDLILQVHERAYWEAMRDLRITPRAMRKIGFPQSATLVDRSKRSVQGTLSAALHALEYGCGGNLAGGTHHAYADHGEGFCLLNDLAITAQYLLAQQKATKILIVDLDVHQGNGTAKIFAQEERVFTFSVHGATNYPLHKEASDLDLALDRDTEDDPYLSIVQTHLSHLILRFQPDVVLFQAGVDVLASDKLGHLSLTKMGCKQRDRIVLETCYQAEIPVAICMGGGYSAKLADTVEAHANTFRVAAEIFG